MAMTMEMKMSDPARIDRILAALGDYWRAHPDLRLGQIVVNSTPPGEPCPRVFYVEDDVIERALAFWPSHLKFRRGQSVISIDGLESNDKRGYMPDTFRQPCMTGTVIAYHDSHGVCYEVQHEGRVGHYDEDELRAIAEGRR